MPPPGHPVRVVMSKWGEGPHWEFDGLLLGSDVFGDWIGVPAGTNHARPGAAYDSEVDTVTLVPPPAAAERGWAATFHAPGIWAEIYVDITTPPAWVRSVGGSGADSWELRAVDLDLDVIRLAGGEVFVDDEDEFEGHAVSLGYPDTLVATARTSCETVLAAVRAGAPPYDGVADAWLARLAALRPG